MKNNQNVLIAIALSFLVIVGWQYLVIGPKLEAERQRQLAEQARTTDAAPGTVTGTQAPDAPAATTDAPQQPGAPGVAPAAPGAGTSTSVLSRADALAA